MTAFIQGSSSKGQKEIARSLSLERDEEGKPLFDVYVLMPGDDDKIKESDTLHKIGLEFMKAADMTFDGEANSVPEKLQRIKEVHYEIFKILNQERHIIDQLRQMDLDIGIMTYLPVETLIMKALHIPYLWYNQHFPNVLHRATFGLPHQAPWNLPLLLFDAETADTSNHL